MTERGFDVLHLFLQYLKSHLTDFLFIIYLFLKSEAEKKVGENRVGPDLLGERLRWEFSLESLCHIIMLKMSFHVDAVKIVTLEENAEKKNTCGFMIAPVLQGAQQTQSKLGEHENITKATIKLTEHL